ncbi:MAG: hypothetical protein HY765_09445, partial [Rhodomicrobium sp.]|nr:hypothetical protein [Rhodomicrobium sp.]
EGRLEFQGSTFLPGGTFAIHCAGARIIGDAYLNDGFLGEGGVFFGGAKIGGDLVCAGGVFRNRTEIGSGIALFCENAEITGNTVLAGGFRSEGLVSFSGAKIGNLNCVEGTFVNRTENGIGAVLSCERAEIEGDVNLRKGFSASGEVTFSGAYIRGDFICVGGRFDNSARAKGDGSKTWTPRAAYALNLQGMRIDGTLWLGPYAGDVEARAGISGSLHLGGCHAHEVVDHPSSWPAKKISTADGETLPAIIFLDGFTYDRLVGTGDYDTSTRKRWLDRQPPQHLGLNFRPQPFEQLIKVYREMGHERHAREIAKFKDRRRYQSHFIKLWHGWRRRPCYTPPLNWLAWPFTLVARAFSRSLISVFYALEWLIVGFGAAYGYGYFRLAVFLFTLWMAGGLFYGVAADQGGFAPSNPVIFLSKELQAKCGKNWTACKDAPPELPVFSPFAYSLDVMLPVLDLGQKRDWQPIDRPDRPLQIGVPTLSWKPINDPDHTEIPDF